MLFNCCFLALKRALRSVYFPILLIVFAVMVFSAPLIGREESLPTAGVCDLDGTLISSRVTDRLADVGFESCENEELLRERIASGEYDCGAVLPRGFGELLENGELDGAVKFIKTPTSYAVDIYKNHIAAAVFGEYAPYITAIALSETEIDRSEVLTKYHEMTESGVLFSFSIEDSENFTVTENERVRTYTLAATSFFVFAIIMYGASDVLCGDIKNLSSRIGIKRVIAHSLIPTVTVRALSLLISYATAAGVYMAVFDDAVLFKLFSAVAVYMLLISAFGVFAVAVFADAGKIQIFTFYMLIISLVLCPIYVDLSLILPWIDGARCFLPPFWLWVASEHTGLLPTALLSVLLSIGAIYLRFRNKTSANIIV